MVVAILLALSTVLSSALLAPVSAQGPPFWSPRVSIVWPHDAAGNPTSVADSTEVNVSVWPTNQVNCTTNPGLSLWIASNNDPAGPLPHDIEGHLIEPHVGGRTFPTLEFNDVPLDLAANPAAKYSILAGNEFGPLSNVWVHAADPRTYAPNPVVPDGYGSPKAGELDARIQIVWPHDSHGNYAPPSQATFVNIAADIFIHGTMQSVPADFQPDAFPLQVAQGNNGFRQLESRAAVPQKTTYTVNGQTYPRWVFNDVPVQPGQQYHFAAFVYWGKIRSPFSSVWTHASDARTTLPNPTPPPECVP